MARRREALRCPQRKRGRHIVAAARLLLVKFISVTFDIAMNRKIATQNIRTAVSCMEHNVE